MTKLSKLIILGIGHLLIDLIGIYILFYQYNYLNGAYLVYAFVVYNLLAFGLQVVVGYYADRFQLYGVYLKISMGLAMIALVFMKVGLFPIIVMTLSNALYHVGGGVLASKCYEGKSMPLGVFVAPGTLGVLIGTVLALQDTLYNVTLFAFLIGLTVFLNAVLKEKEVKTFDLKPHPMVGTLVVLLLGVIAVRAFVGTSLILIWNTSLSTKIWLVTSVFLGKLLGGLLGDRFGFKVIGVGGLVLSIPFLLFGQTMVALGLVGVLLFNLTMAITLFLIMESLSPYRGFAFGLTTLTLVIFFLPTQFGFKLPSGVWYNIIIVASILSGAYMLNKALNAYYKEML
jgi:FSR family fosmidomycin resistance protein-like MFS transporter